MFADENFAESRIGWVLLNTNCLEFDLYHTTKMLRDSRENRKDWNSIAYDSPSRNDRFNLSDGVVGLSWDPESRIVYFQPLATDRYEKLHTFIAGVVVDMKYCDDVCSHFSPISGYFQSQLPHYELVHYLLVKNYQSDWLAENHLRELDWVLRRLVVTFFSPLSPKLPLLNIIQKRISKSNFL